MKNDILNEVRHNRDVFGKKHNHDLKVMAEALQKAEKKETSPVVDRSVKPSRQPRPAHACHLAVHETPAPYQAAKKKRQE
jgi:hypothetical protein